MRQGYFVWLAVMMTATLGGVFIVQLLHPATFSRAVVLVLGGLLTIVAVAVVLARE